MNLSKQQQFEAILRELLDMNMVLHWSADSTVGEEGKYVEKETSSSYGLCYRCSSHRHASFVSSWIAGTHGTAMIPTPVTLAASKTVG